MKRDLSAPLSEDQLEVVRWTQENGNDPKKAADHFYLDVEDVFWWTIQDYEEQKHVLNQRAEQEGFEGELLHQINQIYEKELTFRKLWEEAAKANPKA